MTDFLIDVGPYIVAGGVVLFVLVLVLTVALCQVADRADRLSEARPVSPRSALIGGPSGLPPMLLEGPPLTDDESMREFDVEWEQATWAR